MKEEIIFKTKLQYWYLLLAVFLLLLFQVLVNLIRVNSLKDAFNNAEFMKDPYALIGGLISVGIVISILTAEFTLTKSTLTLKYPLRPFAREYVFNLNEIEKIVLMPGGGRIPAKFIIYFKKEVLKGKKVFRYLTGHKQISKLEDLLVQRGMYIEEVRL